MKIRHSFLILLTAALPRLATMAEDTAKTETANAQTTSDAQNKTSTEKDQMACKMDTTTADLDKLIADMNGASADKKVDAIAVVTKLAQELKTQQQSGTNTTSSEKSGMDMCQMMMGRDMKDGGDNQEGGHEHHH